jgi:hypothetical protein
MQARSPEPRSTGDLIRQAIRIVVVTLVSAAVLVVIGNKIRTTWGVLNTLERRVDGMIAFRSESRGDSVPSPVGQSPTGPTPRLAALGRALRARRSSIWR